MRFDLEQKITEFSVLRNNYLVRDGFVFSSWNDNPSVFDVLVIKKPHDASGNTTNYPHSNRSLDEHIRLIQEANIKRAIIIADDISFLAECPSLKMLSIFPANSIEHVFDYTPLYRLPEIKMLNCNTVYGSNEEFTCSIDYSKIAGLIDLGVYGTGHLNYNSVETLENLWASNIKKSENLYQISCSGKLKELTVLQCGITSLEGIQQYKKLQSLYLSNNRLLKDITMLSEVGKSLRLLVIEGCPQIIDFTCLYNLPKLEHLSLIGSNKLSGLEFLKKMTNLKTFTFSMDIINGDLTPCIQVPYASCVKNKKWYNLKDKDLPKEKPIEPFKVT